ncbi:MAG: hypothetical protein ACE5FL_02185, partial [Myxococcota bacterium]
VGAFLGQLGQCLDAVGGFQDFESLFGQGIGDENLCHGADSNGRSGALLVAKREYPAASARLRRLGRVTDPT